MKDEIKEYYVSLNVLISIVDEILQEARSERGNPDINEVVQARIVETFVEVSKQLKKFNDVRSKSDIVALGELFDERSNVFDASRFYDTVLLYLSKISNLIKIFNLNNIEDAVQISGVLIDLLNNKQRFITSEELKIFQKIDFNLKELVESARLRGVYLSTLDTLNLIEDIKRKLKDRM